MQRQQRLIFGNMGTSGEDQTHPFSKDPIYLHNTLVMEMEANWPWVRWMMDRYRNNDLNQVDPMERDWFNFIIGNKIDVEKYGKDSDLFLDEWFKNKK